MINYRHFYSLNILLALGMFCITRASFAESRRDSDIRTVDFRNFTYPVSGAAAEVTKTKSIRVRNGIFEKQWEEKNGSLGSTTQSISFSVNSVSYGDINRDGSDEAVVDTGFSWMGGYQQDESRMYVYTVGGGRPELLKVPDIEDQVRRDFSRHNKSRDPCEEGIYAWSAKASGEGLVKVDATVGNPHTCYDARKGYPIVSMSYRLSDNRWVLAESPKRWRKK
jgi:hypothetical protein